MCNSKFLNISTGPDNWPGMCTTGKKQSPIDIVTEDAVRFDLGALKFDRYDFAFSGMIINTGHSGKLHILLYLNKVIFDCRKQLSMQIYIFVKHFLKEKLWKETPIINDSNKYPL